MYVTAEQQDALSELINIGFGRAAATLSVLVGQRVLLEAPRVEILSIPELRSFIVPLATGNEIIVEQLFKGALSGNTLLFMDSQSISVLVDLLGGGPGVEHPITEYDREAMLEIGNILLNSYIGSFGNLLKTQITFLVPELRTESLDDLLIHFETGNGQVTYTLLVKTEFHFTNRSIGGYIVLIVGISSLEDLFRAIENVSTR
jgi:chemotaxis protein CheC